MSKHEITKTEEGFFVRKGKLFISSLQVAEKFGRQHGNILGLIRRTIESNPKLKRSFYEEYYTSKNNIKNPMFLMNRKGFEIVTNKYNSSEDFIEKAKFIDVFLFEEAKQKIKKIQGDYNIKDSVEAVVIEEPKTELVAVERVRVEPTIVESVQKEYNDMQLTVVNEQPKSDELIKTQVNESNEIIVSGRELHEFLEVKTKYVDWFKRMVEYGFEENVDFIVILKNEKDATAFGGIRKITDHALKLDMAKEISMIQRNEKGKQARQYFIETEKRYKQVQSTPAIPMASYMIGDPIERAKLWIQEEQQRVALVETVSQQVEVIEHKQEIIEKQVEVIQEQTQVIQEKDEAIKKLKNGIEQSVSSKYENAHVLSGGLSPEIMAQRIRGLIGNDYGKWTNLYNSYEGKYGVNLNNRKNQYARENNLVNLRTIDYVKKDTIHISQLYALANELYGTKKDTNKSWSLATI